MKIPNWFPYRPRSNGRLAPALQFLPDYRDISAYPDPSLPPERWAWEFLRRYPLYRAFWAEHVEPAFSNALRAEYVSFQMNRGSDGKYDLPAAEDWHALRSIVDGFNKTFGIIGFPPDPAQDGLVLQIERVTLFDLDILSESEQTFDFLDEFRDHGLAIATLTKGADIEVHLNEIRELFNGLPAQDRARPRNRPHNWRIHLQLIDALYTGATTQELLEFFEIGVNSHESEYRQRKSLQSKVDRAMFMMRRGYRYINPAQ